MLERLCYTEGMKRKKKIADINKLASFIVSKATKEAKDGKPVENKPEKNPAAVALGRLGGLKGGKVRAKKLTPKQRAEIARIAAMARWKKSSR